MRREGVGILFLPDGREWGQVRYYVDEQPKTQTALGRTNGRLTPVEDRGPFPFADVSEGALRMDDHGGRWWLCALQPDGEALNRGGLHAAGPQPKIR